MILDATTWEKRQGPDKPAETPAMESARRGKTEEFARAVGRITVNLGQSKQSISTGTLIAPNIVLTAAHCVDKINKLTPGYFELNGVQSKIIAVEMSASYLLKLLSSKALNFEEDDIAVVLLETPITRESYPELFYEDNPAILVSNTIDSGRVPKFVGVSAGILTKNGDSSTTYSGRHIGIFAMRKTQNSSSGRLEAESWIPVDYQPQPVKLGLDGKIYVPEFSYDFKRDQTFLHATLRGGDSGGPLFAKIDGKMRIVGVAGGQLFQDAYNSKTQSFVPAKTYRDCWTSLYNHRFFLQSAIEKFSQ
jgi:hypothetical protein